MAFTTPATVVAGTAATASYANTYIRDNIAWMATDSPACHAYNNTTNVIATGSNVAVTMNSERFDNSAVHSTSVNTARLTAPTGGGGKYLIGNNIEWQNATSGTYRDVELRINGATYVASNTMSFPSGGLGNDNIRQSVVVVYAMSAADYVEAVVTQNTGGNLNLTNGTQAPACWCFWLRT